MSIQPTTAANLEELGKSAWCVRECAFVIGKTRVGCALLADDGKIYVGCNVEHRFRCHDVHAEVNAISSMVAGGGRRIVAIVIAAERDHFTPCGGCMDWIMQFGSGCIVAFQVRPGSELVQYTASQLMPFYPS
ncbi:MAG: cytidine deaminase family protein [Bryobacteraceae bacterium]